MAEVRAQERLNRRITEQGIHAALKHVASIQDQHQTEDTEADQPVLAPSLRRHETLLVMPRHTDLSTEKDDTDIDKETEREEEVAQVNIDGEEQETGIGEDSSNMDDGGEGEEQCRKTKKKGDNMRILIEALRKQPRPSGKLMDVSLVAKVPLILAAKGKKSCAACVITSICMPLL